MFQKEWEILLVDDEPDVLAVSKLAMRGFNVYGVPLKIRTCASKAEAVELFNTKADVLPALAVAFIDVVMETDEAGLELCQYIREERNNQLTQLFIRTGQPGVAPERTVIDRYDINGYFTKVEATPDKLYSLVTSGVRQFYRSSFTLGHLKWLEFLSRTLGSRAAIATALQQGLDAALKEKTGEPVASYTNLHFGFIFGDDVVANYGWDAATALAARNQLNELPGVPLGPDGDKYVFTDDNHMLIKVAPQPGLSEAYMVLTPAFRVPPYVPEVMHGVLVSYAAMWQHSA